MKHLDVTLDYQYQDEGAWRSFHLYTYGNTPEQFIQNAGISEVDQEGEELDSYALEVASEEVQKEAKQRINDEIENLMEVNVVRI